MEPKVIDLKSFFFTSKGNLVLKLPQSTALAVLREMLYVVFLFSFGSKYFPFFFSFSICFPNTLFLFLLCLTGYLEECCFVSKYLELVHMSFCYWLLISHH